MDERASNMDRNRYCFTAMKFAALGLLGWAAIAGPDAQAGGLVAHRAIYDLKLAEASGRSGIASFDGHMVYEFTGSSCEGYTVNYKFNSRMIARTGTQRNTDMQTTTFEDPDQRRFDFVIRKNLNPQQTEVTKGFAKGGPTASSRISMPVEKTIDLPDGVMFPTEHMVRVIEAARQGERFVEAKIYDGSEKGERVHSASAFIGPAKPHSQDLGDEPAADLPQLENQDMWPVSIAYFKFGKTVGEVLPDYEMSFLLYENGVTRRLKMDYGAFVVTGNLRAIELLETKPCQ